MNAYKKVISIRDDLQKALGTLDRIKDEIRSYTMDEHAQYVTYKFALTIEEIGGIAKDISEISKQLHRFIT